ncbi:MAG: type II toxin-antitoxin system VapC family toxin [Candidatus Competibacteraceae bacterium]
MIGLDTNVLVRYLTQDDEAQTALANRLIETVCSEENPGFISHIVLCELTWVLKAGYKVPKSDMLRIIQQILETKQLAIQESRVVWSALKLYENSNIDFADAVIVVIHRTQGCTKTVTFDKSIGKLPDVIELGAEIASH